MKAGQITCDECMYNHTNLAGIRHCMLNPPEIHIIHPSVVSGNESPTTIVFRRPEIKEPTDEYCQYAKK